MTSYLNTCSYPSREPNSDPSDCVITENSGFLTIVKVADPDDSTNFVFNSSAASTGGVSSWTIQGSGDVQFIPFVAGNTLDLNEVVPGGWELDSAACVRQTATPIATGTPTATGVDNITIQAGVETKCTFNDSLAEGTLKIVKTVINDNGGTLQVANFPLFMNGTSVTSGQVVSFEGGTAVTATETQQTGYTASVWGGDCAANGTVTIVANVDKTCTITNDDNAPKLTLNKVVTNDNGGTALESAWTLTATGNPVTDPATLTGPGAAGNADVVSGAGFDAGTYDLSESGGPAGYTASTWSCTGGQTGTEAKVTVALGADITCTITNDDSAPKLTLNKVVINNNGGTALESAWTLTATGNPVTDPATLTGPGAAGNADVVSGAGFDAGTYDLSESGGPANYTASTWSCTGGQTGTQAKVTVALGADITCTIINNDQVPSLTLIKTVTNDNGGSAVATNWILTADGTGSNDISGDGGAISDGSLLADTFALSESTARPVTPPDRGAASAGPRMGRTSPSPWDSPPPARSTTTTARRS